MSGKRYWVVAGLLMAWSVMGDAAYLSQVTADLKALARTDPATARAFAQMPQWAWGAYAIAVWVGTLGSAALLLRRKIALPLYVVSLVAVLVQFAWTFAGSSVIAEKGASAAVFPLVIIGLAVFAVWFAARAKRDGVLR